jgi:uncharacterized membrane-anchored protein YjiN (DUF445 family)
MISSSEFEHRKKLNKVREEANKRVEKIRNCFAEIEKVKTEALKRIEDLRQFVGHDMRKLEENIAKSELTSDIKKTLASDMATLRKEIEDRATELRKRISGTVIPP